MLWWMLALTGCATTTDVLFVTKASIGIDFDAKPASASIGYDRTEGYIAPRYDNGEIPPVVASIRSDGGIFNPKIRQVYATGDAAVIAVSEDPKAVLTALDPESSDGKTKKKLKGEKKLMFFGTSTTTGLKVGFTTYVPDSFVFGFKRKEYSFIPLGEQEDTDGTTYDVYPSVLASIDTAANAGTADKEGVKGDTSLSNSQFFATGRAARELAAKPTINKAFIAQATTSLRAEQAEKGVNHDDAVKTKEELTTSIKGKFNNAKNADPSTAAAVAEKATGIAIKEAGGYDPAAADSEDIDERNFLKKLRQLSEGELKKLDKSINDNGQVNLQ
jgi:hypothetical protein